MTDFDQQRRIARQHLRTNQLFGVNVIPIRIPVEVAAPGRDAPPVHVNCDVDRTKHAELVALASRHDAECPHCTHATAHTRTVFGEGNVDAQLMFIGEAPGAEEDRQGRPFVGRSGQKLDQIITAMGLSREVVYIANVLKSRPPNNRTPLQHEIDACSAYLHEQIRMIRPEVIVTLGGPATKLLLRTDTGITRLRGSWSTYIDEAESPALEIPVMPTFHPAYLLRNYTPETRQMVWDDMQQVMTRLSGGTT